MVLVQVFDHKVLLLGHLVVENRRNNSNMQGGVRATEMRAAEWMDKVNSWAMDNLLDKIKSEGLTLSTYRTRAKKGLDNYSKILF